MVISLNGLGAQLSHRVMHCHAATGLSTRRCFRQNETRVSFRLAPEPSSLETKL